MTKYLDNEGLAYFTEKMKGYADGKASEENNKVTSHIGNKSNPHGVTKAQVGLSKVINETQIPSDQKGAANGVATLDAKGKVPTAQIPQTKTINGESIFGEGNLQLSASLYEIVDELPTTGIDTSKIYLVPAQNTTAKNNKTEYIYLGDPNKAYDESKWEKLGDEQKNTTVTTPGGTITVDTAFNTASSNPIANKTVTAKFNEVVKTLDGKVAQGTYDTKMGDIDSKLIALENKTITVDAELKSDSTNPIQNKAVKSAVEALNTAIGKKADASALDNYVNDVKTSGTGNGITDITKSGKVITATKGTFLTAHQSLTGYATQSWVGQQGFAKGTIPTKTSQLTNDSGFLTEHQSLDGYVNAVEEDALLEYRPSIGIANIALAGNTLKYRLVRFVTEKTLGDYVKTKDLGTAIDTYASNKGYLTKDSLKETVTIKLVSDKSESDTNLNGATITVKSGDKTVSTQTWTGTPIKVVVACDKEVTIEAAAVKMYVKPKVLKYAPSPLYNREVTFT